MGGYTRRQLDYLDAMGIPAWVLRGAPRSASNADVSAAVAPASAHGHEPSKFPGSLQSAVVFSTGEHHSAEPGRPLLVIVDRSRVEHDSAANTIMGEAALRLFDAMLVAIEQSRLAADLWVLDDTEHAHDTPTDRHSTQQRVVDLLQWGCYAVVLLLTVPTERVGAPSLTTAESALSRLQPGDVPCIVLHHPEHLLHHPGAKRTAWDALKRVRSLLLRVPSRA